MGNNYRVSAEAESEVKVEVEGRWPMRVERMVWWCYLVLDGFRALGGTEGGGVRLRQRLRLRDGGLCRWVQIDGPLGPGGAGLRPCAVGSGSVIYSSQTVATQSEYLRGEGHQKGHRKNRILLGANGLQVVAEALFQLLKHGLHVCDAFSHAAPVKLEAVAMKGNVSEAAIGREGSGQGAIKQQGQVRLPRRTEMLKQLCVPGFACRQRNVVIAADTLENVFNAVIELR